MNPLIGAALISGAASLGGGFMSAQGAAGANAANLAQSNMLNQQMLNMEMAKHEQNTAFQEDAQSHQLMSQHIAQDFSSREADRAREWSAGEAQKQMNFQAHMANTAYQRAMQDMRAAGLNPILAYKQGGSASPGGAMGSAGTASSSGGSAGMASSTGSANLRAANILNDKEAIGRALGNSVSTAVDAMRTVQGVEVMKADEKLKSEQTRRVGYETANIDAQTGKTLADTNVSKQEERNKQIEEIILRANAITAAANARTATVDATTSEKYGGKYEPGTWERIWRSLEDHFTRHGPTMPAPPSWDNSKRLF